MEVESADAVWRPTKRKQAADSQREALFPTERPMEQSWDVRCCVQTDLLNAELRCPICLEIMREPTATPCLHRFCAECIEKCLRVGKLECPSCRQPVATRRSLRKDINFGLLVRTFYPDRELLTLEENKLVAEGSDSYRGLHSQKMRELLASRHKQQRMAAPHRAEEEPLEAPLGKEGSEGEATSEESGSEGGAGEEGEEEGEEEEGEGGGEAPLGREEAPRRSNARPQFSRTRLMPTLRPTASKPVPVGPLRPRGGVSGTQHGGKRPPAAKSKELKPRRSEYGFLLRVHPTESHLQALERDFVTTSAGATVKHVQSFLSLKLDRRVAWDEVQLTVASGGASFVLDPDWPLQQVVAAYSLDTAALRFDYRRRFWT